MYRLKKMTDDFLVNFISIFNMFWIFFFIFVLLLAISVMGIIEYILDLFKNISDRKMKNLLNKNKNIIIDEDLYEESFNCPPTNSSKGKKSLKFNNYEVQEQKKKIRSKSKSMGSFEK